MHPPDERFPAPSTLQAPFKEIGPRPPNDTSDTVLNGSRLLPVTVTVAPSVPQNGASATDAEKSGMPAGVVEMSAWSDVVPPPPDMVSLAKY